MSAQTVFYRDRNGFAAGAAHGRVGRLSRDGISVCGFASAADAVTAASVAFHALRTEFAERSGRPLARLGGPGHAAAVSVHAQPDSSPAPFCFELQFPMRLTGAKAIRAARTVKDALRRWTKELSEGAHGTYIGGALR
jgi:hypothetical protein